MKHTNHFTNNDRRILRDLAGHVADAAADPVMEQRRSMWIEHNSLRSTRPMILVFPEGAWGELLPDSALLCETSGTRTIERDLRRRIYAYEHFHDDAVVEAEWVQCATIHNTGWGLAPRRRDSTQARGAWAYDPVLKERSDLKKMRQPELTYDEEASQSNVERMQDLFGDILKVKSKGMPRISYHLAAQYANLRGLGEMMMDMAEQPGFIHEAMAFFEEGHRRMLQQIRDFNLLSLNNDNTYNTTGGNGYTDELPKPGFDPAAVRTCDLWASAEAQELAQVSPAMHREFLMQYEKRLLEPFGLTGYGCCEDLTHKLDDVFTIPNVRRISISPWGNVDVCAEKLKGDYIFSWKPHPSHLVGGFDPDAIRAYIRHTLEVGKANQCVLEMVLKDTHTCEHHPERFDEWTRIARELVDEFAGGVTEDPG